MSDLAARRARRSVYEGRVVRLFVDEVEFPDGRTGPLELVEHPGAAAILPFLQPPASPDPEVLLLRQYRYAGGGELVEVPAGTRDAPDEAWETCARRELQEETGYSAGALQRIGVILTTPGFTDERIALFAAWDLEPGVSATDSDEYLETFPLPISQAMDYARSGRITDAKTLCTLFLADAWRKTKAGG